MPLILSILFLLSGFLLGLRITSWLDSEHRLTPLENWVVTLCTGFVGLGFLILLGTLTTGYLKFATYAALVVGYAAMGNVSSAFVARARSMAQAINLLNLRKNIFFVLFSIIVLGITWQVLIVDEAGFPRAALPGWGDVAYHLDMIGHFAYPDKVTFDQPIADGEPLTYSFVINLMSAALLKLGLPLSWAWKLPSVIFTFTLLGGLYAFGLRIFEKKFLANMLLFLILFGGGLGFFWFFKDASQAYGLDGVHGIVETLRNPPHEYTHLDNRTGGKTSSADGLANIVWITPITSFFSHQRSFPVGFSLVLVVLLGWFLYGHSNPSSFFARWVILLGFLPLIHAHSAFGAGFLFAGLFLEYLVRGNFNYRPWLKGATIAFLIALPQVFFLLAPGMAEGSSESSFLKPWFGWMTCLHSQSWFFCDQNIPGTDSNAVWFWIKNFGILFVGWVLAFFIFYRRKISSPFLIPSIVLFLVPNFFLLQPWEFDNNKVLFYWWFLAIILVLQGLNILFQTAPKYLAILCAVFLVIVGSFAGVLDTHGKLGSTLNILKKEPLTKHYGYYNETDVEAALWIRNNTNSQDGILTADNANNFVPMLTGRPIYLGFNGWIWSQGRGDVILKRKQIGDEFFRTGNPTALCTSGIRWLMWESGVSNTYPAARLSRVDQLGSVEFSQATPGGQRLLIRLSCPTQ